MTEQCVSVGKIYLTIVKNGEPIEPSIPLADEMVADAYLRQRFGNENSRHMKMRGYVWFSGKGVSRIVFDSAKPDVMRTLPGGAGLVFFLDSEATFTAMEKDRVWLAQRAINSER